MINSGIFVLCCVFLVGCAANAIAAVVPNEPVLRIETGTHLGAITRISGDPQGRYAVTASEDKTARLWDLRSGRPLAVLRPPLGDENLGALYSVAMSPDARQVALGGYSAFDGQSHALYLFDRATATLPPKSTLAGLEAPITQLAWSIDSQFIAVGLRQEGLRIFRRNLGFVGADPEFNEAIYGLAFARDGRLAAVSLDGFLRLYRFAKAGVERVARIQLPGKPYALAWSPNNKHLAVGMQDASRVLIINTNPLEVLHTVDLGGDGNLSKVAWSKDGQTLFAGGSANRDGGFPVFAFANAGLGRAQETITFGNIVTSLDMNDSGLLASSAQPAWGALDITGLPRFSVDAAIGDFRDAMEAFRISDDGSQVSFPMQMRGAELVNFDFSLAELRTGAATKSLQAAQIPGALKDWRNSSTPKFNGRSLALSQGERVRSAAGLSDGRFVLGSDWFLRGYSSVGAQLWTQRMPSTVWAVNLSRDGRWVVAGLGDGSVRWYRLSDGREQLALFVHGDKERWIAWTPSGHYDTSMGGEGLIGWHVNRAFNQAADFFSAGRFRDRHYAPSIVQKVMQLTDFEKALAEYKTELPALERTNIKTPAQPVQSSDISVRLTNFLPPLIEIQSERTLESNASTVPIRYSVRTPENAPLKDLKVRVNGKLERGLKPRALRTNDGQIFELSVPVPPRDSEILLIAENKHAKSDPVGIQVRRPDFDTDQSQLADRYETLYMLVVAVDKYPEGEALELPVKDANDFYEQMHRIANPPQGKPRLYNRMESRILLDKEATQENIRAGLAWLKSSVKAKDAGVLFLAGHGLSDEKTYFYIPYREKTIGQKEGWLSGNEIIDTLQNIPGRAMFFLDTCHAGALANQAKVAGTVNRIEEEKGVIVFASSTAKELSQEKDEWGNGAFTKALIEGLRGEAADPKDGLIYPTTLKRQVTRRVRELTVNEQRPYISDHGIDDPIAIVVK